MSRQAIILAFKTLDEVEEHINRLLTVQPDAQIVSVLKDNDNWLSDVYRVVEIRDFGGFKD